jgi:transcriptional regulator with XRE-family HTH domain
MPKQPSFYSIVRTIRQSLKLTQDRLADRLGVYVSIVRRIENGTLGVSDRIAQSLAELSGVPALDIRSNRAGRLRSRYKAGVTPRLLTDQDKRARELSAAQRKTLLDNYSYHAELLLNAVLLAAPHQLWALDTAIEAALSEIERRFGLSATVKDLREKRLDPQIVQFLQRFRPPAEVTKSGRLHA